MNPRGGRPIYHLKLPFFLNLTYQGEYGQHTGATENWQLTGIKCFIPIQTRVANKYSIPQVHHKYITPLDSTVHLSTVLSPALTIDVNYRVITLLKPKYSNVPFLLENYS